MANHALDRLIPAPRLSEADGIDVALSPDQAWQLVRHGEIAMPAIARALFALRTLPSRLLGKPAVAPSLSIDAFTSGAQPGFRVLIDDPPREVAVAAVGKVWQPDIPFVEVADTTAFAAFAEPGYAKVAWAVRVLPRGAGDSRIEVDLRVTATDEPSWRAFRRYFRLVGPFSRLIRRSALEAWARKAGTPQEQEDERPLPGDEMLPDATQATHGITIARTPEEIWPWLLQMGGRRAGFYSIDALDNAGRRSARELHPELSHLAVGDFIPALPWVEDGFEVLHLERPRALVLGSLFDVDGGDQLPFGAPRPRRYWHVTWAFALEALDEKSTRLHVRARAACPPGDLARVAVMRPVHHLMETMQLRHLAARVEGRMPRDDWRDVLEGAGGAALMALSAVTPFLRGFRNRWGIDAATAMRKFPGDELLKEPRWGWTHGIEIDAPAPDVWPWIAQVGSDRGGFYSYQWLENLAGCDLRNAEAVHPEWQHREGDQLRLHPRAPPLRVVALVPGSHFVAVGATDAKAGDATATWLLLVEPLGEKRCRVISRFRYAAADAALRVAFATVAEPIGFTMDRRMLLGIKERAEQTARPPAREARR